SPTFSGSRMFGLHLKKPRAERNPIKSKPTGHAIVSPIARHADRTHHYLIDMATQQNNPTDKYPKPPFPKKPQDVPGTESAMDPQADHGEQSYKGKGRLVDKVAIITGGDSGIGKAVAIAFAREGADVLISYLDDVEDRDAQDTANYVQEAGRKAVLVKGDISSERHCQNVVETAVKEFGKIDILVNNAAYQMSRETLQDIPAWEWEKTFAVNIHSMFYLCKAAEPHMPPGSCIINTTSV